MGFTVTLNRKLEPFKSRICVCDKEEIRPGGVDQVLRGGAIINRRKLITLPSPANPAPSASASVAPSWPARPKHSAANAAPVVCPIRRAVATMPLALPLRCGGALDMMAFMLGV